MEILKELFLGRTLKEISFNTEGKVFAAFSQDIGESLDHSWCHLTRHSKYKNVRRSESGFEVWTLFLSFDRGKQLGSNLLNLRFVSFAIT